MFFIDTRNQKVLGKFQDIVLNNARNRDCGLFVPSFLVKIDNEEIHSLSNKSYKQILITLLSKFSDNSIDIQTLTTLVNNAYKNFNRGFGPPLNNLNLSKDDCFSMQTLTKNVEIVNLTHGPTGCVKDYGYCLTAELINYFAKKQNQMMSVIDVSNGSSGASMAWAIRDKEYLKGFALMNKTKNNSIHALISQAKTDNIDYAVTDCDVNFINKMNKDIQNNICLYEIINLSFINEINLINIIAYLPVFFKIYKRCNMKPFCISVPTGNMTLGIAAFFAKQMGIPVKKIILATEKNNFLYDIQDVKVAMQNYNIEDGCSNLYTNIPTNFERLLFYLYSNNQTSLNRSMKELESNDRYRINDHLFLKFAENFFVAKCDNQFNIRNVIYSTIKEKELYVEQHFAIAKIAVDVAQSEIPNEVANLPVVIFNTLDYRRNISFVNSALGYDLTNVDFPWTDEDVKQFSPTEIIQDTNAILTYILNVLEAKKIK